MLTEKEQQFAIKAIRRKSLFFVLSMISILVAVGFALYSYLEFSHQLNLDLGLHISVVILMLLNARQNMRQYRYAIILQTMLKQGN